MLRAEFGKHQTDLAALQCDDCVAGFRSLVNDTVAENDFAGRSVDIGAPPRTPCRFSLQEILQRQVTIRVVLQNGREPKFTLFASGVTSFRSQSGNSVDEQEQSQDMSFGQRRSSW